jgi:hypothetical protein
LTFQESEMLERAVASLEQLRHDIDGGAAKLDCLRRLLASDPALRVLARGRETAVRLREWLDHDLVLDLDKVHEPFIEGGAVIPSWFGRRRMQRLLVPPCANPLHLVLYGLETRWYERTRDILEERRQARLSAVSRSTLFPGVSGWSSVSSPTQHAAVQPRTETRPGLDELVWDEVSVRRDRALRQSRVTSGEPECEATLTLFTDGSHGFFSQEKRLLRVTHLVQGAEGEPVEEVTVAELEPGDAVLIPEEADRDVLRELADRVLPEGSRELARSWQRALREHARCNGLTTREVADQLRKLGCSRHPVTVRNWLESEEMVGPRTADDVHRIAELTRDRHLEERIDGVKAAISAVRGAHLRAASQLAQRFVAQMRERLEAGEDIDTIGQISDGVIMVRVEDVDTRPTAVARSMVNRLLLRSKGDPA